jgi:Mg2+ and Co2+ transporter CorA
MDADSIRSLLREGSMYTDPSEVGATRLGIIGLKDGNAVINNDSPSTQMLDGWLTDASTTTKIAYVGMKRRYFHRATSNALKVSRQQWIQLLSSLEVLPSALELMYDNNGGFSGHITYQSEDSNSTMREEERAPLAYHFCLKLGDSWPNHEHFIYLRHDFDTNQQAVLVAGTESSTLCQRLFGRLINADSEKTDIFSILVMMLSLWLNQAEENRWELDYQVQDIESRTGYSSMQYKRFEPLSPEQMSLSKDMAQTADSLAMMLTYMENFTKGINFAIDQQLRFQLCRKENGYNWPSVSQLQDTLAQYHSQACSKKQQIQTLQGRITAQINVTNTLIAHRDSRANIELATSMQEDARLMRGISMVTMVFLPATFLATFFSMTFFHIGGTENSLTFEVSRWIWLYPLCTVPLTLVLAYQYGLEEKLRDWLTTVTTRFRQVAFDSEAASDPEAQVEIEHKDGH